MVIDKKQALELLSSWVVPALLILLVPMTAVIILSNHDQNIKRWHANMQACARGNILRTKINQKFLVYDQAFAGSALALGGSTTDVGKELHRILGLAATTAPGALPLTDCKTAYPKPGWF